MNGQNWGDSLSTDSAKQATIRRMYAEGHQIGSHTWSHIHMDDSSAAVIENEMYTLENALISLIGVAPT